MALTVMWSERIAAQGSEAAGVKNETSHFCFINVKQHRQIRKRRAEQDRDACQRIDSEHNPPNADGPHHTLRTGELHTTHHTHLQRVNKSHT